VEDLLKRLSAAARDFYPFTNAGRYTAGLMSFSPGGLTFLWLLLCQDFFARDVTAVLQIAQAVPVLL
jgi:hypothetical protein